MNMAGSANSIPKKKIVHETLTLFQIIIAKIMGRSISMAAVTIKETSFNIIDHPFRLLFKIIFNRNYSANLANIKSLLVPSYPTHDEAFLKILQNLETEKLLLILHPMIQSLIILSKKLKKQFLANLYEG